MGADQPGDRERPMTDRQPRPDADLGPILSFPPRLKQQEHFLDSNELIINMGPQHPRPMACCASS